MHSVPRVEADRLQRPFSRRVMAFIVTAMCRAALFSRIGSLLTPGLDCDTLPTDRALLRMRGQTTGSRSALIFVAWPLRPMKSSVLASHARQGS